MKSRTFTTLDWKKYLDPNNNLRVARFLEKRGFEVMNQVSQNIHKAATKGMNEVAILVHPNASAISIVPKTDFIEALDHCKDWFQAKEEYEMCARIVKYKEDIVNLRKPIQKKKEVRKLI
jgi:hypothetical protein